MTCKEQKLITFTFVYGEVLPYLTFTFYQYAMVRYVTQRLLLPAGSNIGKLFQVVKERLKIDIFPLYETYI